MHPGLNHLPVPCWSYLSRDSSRCLILESPFTNIREEAKSHPFSVASTELIKNGLMYIMEIMAIT